MKNIGWGIWIVTISIGAAACNGARDDDANGIGTSGAGDEPGTARVADIVESPDAYLGRTVTVEADLEEVFGPRAFALDEDAPFAGGIDNDLLVLSKEAGRLEGIDDQWLNNRVRVTGTVGRMTVVEAERELGWDLDPELEIELEGARAVLIASSVDRVGQGAGLTGEPSQASTQARAELPATASPLPLAGLIGIFSIGTALGMRYLRRR